MIERDFDVQKTLRRKNTSSDNAKFKRATLKTLRIFLLQILLVVSSALDAAGQEGERPSTPPPPRTLQLTINSEPDSCEVSVNGRSRGKTDAQGRRVLNLKRGTYKVRVSREGYEDAERTITLTRNHVEQFALVPLFIDLTVSTTPPETQVYLDGEYKGTTGSDGRLTILQIQAGQHKIRVQRKCYLSQDQTVTILPQSASLALSLPPDPVCEQIRAIEDAVKNGQLADAFNRYERLAQDNPDHSDVSNAFKTIWDGLQTKSQALLAQTGAFGHQPSAEQAEEMGRLYERAQKERPQDQRTQLYLHFWRAEYWNARAGQAKEDEDKKHFLDSQRLEVEKLSGFDIDDAYVHYDLGWYYEPTDPNRAKQHLLRAQTLQPGWALPHYALAKLSFNEAEQERDKRKKEEKYRKTIEGFTQAIRTDGNLFHAYVDRCITYAKLKRHKEALRDGQDALKRKPQSALAHYALGFAYYQQGRREFPRAKQALEQALVSKEDPLNDDMRRLVEQWLREINAGRQ